MKKLQKSTISKFSGTEYVKKVIYFVDPPPPTFNIVDKFKREVYEPSASLGIRFTNVEHWDGNPFYPDHICYGILFFDYEGMAPTSSSLQYLSKELLDKAKQHPNSLYCIVSSTMAITVRDTLKELSCKPTNVFLRIEELCTFLNGGR